MFPKCWTHFGNISHIMIYVYFLDVYIVMTTGRIIKRMPVLERHGQYTGFPFDFINQYYYVSGVTHIIIRE